MENTTSYVPYVEIKDPSAPSLYKRSNFYVNDENFETVFFTEISIGDMFWYEGSFYIRIVNSDFCKQSKPHEVYGMCNAFNVSDLKFEDIPGSIKVLFCKHLIENETLPQGISLESFDEWYSKVDTERRGEDRT